MSPHPTDTSLIKIELSKSGSLLLDFYTPLNIYCIVFLAFIPLLPVKEEESLEYYYTINKKINKKYTRKPLQIYVKYC